MNPDPLVEEPITPLLWWWCQDALLEVSVLFSHFHSSMWRHIMRALTKHCVFALNKLRALCFRFVYAIKS